MIGLIFNKIFDVSMYFIGILIVNGIIDFLRESFLDNRITKSNNFVFIQKDDLSFKRDLKEFILKGIAISAAIAFIGAIYLGSANCEETDYATGRCESYDYSTSFDPTTEQRIIQFTSIFTFLIIIVFITVFRAKENHYKIMLDYKLENEK